MEENNNIYSVDLIIENQAYNTIKEQVICPICNGLKLYSKVTTCSSNCQYSVCGECSTKINKCPICRGRPNWKDSIVINQLLNSLDFKCEKCRSIVHFKNLRNHYILHGINNNQIIFNDSNIQRSSNERLRREPILIRENNNNNNNRNNNNSEHFNLCDFLRSDRCSKLINFYNIIFIRKLFIWYYSFKYN